MSFRYAFLKYFVRNGEMIYRYIVMCVKEKCKFFVKECNILLRKIFIGIRTRETERDIWYLLILSLICY